MNTLAFVRLGSALTVLLTLAACSASFDEEVASASEAALTAESVSTVCRTLGEIGQCGSASSLCRGQTEGQCKPKTSAIETDPEWERLCRAMSSEQACGWQHNTCVWEEATTCVPRSGRTSTGPVSLPLACSALGELGQCDRVSICKSSWEGICRATDDGVASDPQWLQMCPRAGTNPEACAAQGFCQWEEVNACAPKAAAATPLDMGTACRTLGEQGACSTISACRTTAEPTCVAKESAAADDPEWIRICRGTGNPTACGWLSNFCTWQEVDQCVPLGGPRAGSRVDSNVACDSFGQLGQCQRAPFCKPVRQGVCRPTANALAGDPEWANQCPRAGLSEETCGFMAPSCKWEPLTRCIPR